MMSKNNISQRGTQKRNCREKPEEIRNHILRKHTESEERSPTKSREKTREFLKQVQRKVVNEKRISCAERRKNLEAFFSKKMPPWAPGTWSKSGYYANDIRGRVGGV